MDLQKGMQDTVVTKGNAVEHLAASMFSVAMLKAVTFLINLYPTAIHLLDKQVLVWTSTKEMNIL